MSLQITPSPIELSSYSSASHSGSSSGGGGDSIRSARSSRSYSRAAPVPDQGTSQLRSIRDPSKEHQAISTSGFKSGKSIEEAAENAVEETNETTEEAEVDPFDDDGIEYPSDSAFKRRAWLVVFGSFVGFIPCWGLSNAVGPLLQRLTTHELKDSNPVTISWIFSLYMMMANVTSIFSGRWFDRSGARKPLIVATILFCGGLVAIANATEVWQYALLFGIITSTGSGIAMTVLAGSPTYWFSKRERAMAMSLATNGGPVGGTFFPLLMQKCYASIGYTWSMRLIALISLLCFIVAIILVKERRIGEREQLSRKEEMKAYLTKSIDVKALVKDKRYRYNTIGCVFAEAGAILTVTFYSYVLNQSGFSENDSFLFMIIINAVEIFSRWFSGFLADKWFGSYNVIIALLAFCGVLDLVAWLPFKSNRAAMYAFSILTGLGAGGQLSLIPNCCAQIVRADVFGTRYATAYSLVGIFAFALIPACSAMIKQSISGFIVFVSLLSIAGSVFYNVAKVMTVGWKLRKF